MHHTSSRSHRLPLTVPLLFMGVIALMILLTFVAQRGWEPASTQARPASASTEHAIPSEDPLTFGPDDAPVTLTVFSDYDCAFCAHWSTTTLPLMFEYVERGELRLEWRDVHANTDTFEHVANAVYSAAMQGKFAEYHAAVVARPSHADLDEQDLVEIAKNIGLDVDAFTAALHSEEVHAATKANHTEGQQRGVSDTPAFILNGHFISGVQPSEFFVHHIDTMLAEAEG